MSEKNVHDQLLNARTISDRLDRIENIVGTGMPDVNGCFDGFEFWIETKNPTEPKRANTPLFGSNHRFSTEQKNWALRQRNAGGNVFMFIGTDKRYMLIDGKHMDAINEWTIEQCGAVALWMKMKGAHGAASLREAIVMGCRANLLDKVYKNVDARREIGHDG